MNKIQPNTTVHGNSFEILSKIPEKSVDVILTDPPYDFPRESIYKLHSHFMRIARKAIIVFSPPENQWMDYELELMQPNQYIFWKKPISTKNTSRSYGRFMEMIFLYHMEDYTYNTQYHWSNYINIWDDKVLGFSDHPFEKPVDSVRRLILNHSNPRDIILDPFAGSGIVPILCKIHNRQYIAIEQKEEYYTEINNKLDTIDNGGNVWQKE